MRFFPLLTALLLALPGVGAAHEIPARVTVQAWVRPEPGSLTVIMRVPLEAMRDVAFPLRGDGYIDMESSRHALMEAAELWLADALDVRADGQPLGKGRVIAARIALPGDGFSSYAEALQGLGAAPATGIDLPWQQALMDVHLDFALPDAQADVTLRPALAHLGLSTTTVIRYAPAAGPVRVYQYAGDPGLVRLDPRWHHAAFAFVRLGFMHILGGLDHLLFLLCLVLPMRRFAPLLVVVTSFTVAHSITLIASALGFAPGGFWFPPLIEVLIALSIVWMALENIVGARTERRWALAFGFGLVHGFGFSFLLRDSLQLAGGHLAASLIAFNAGVELGQVIVLLVLVPALALLFRYGVAERVGTILISALVAHSAWHWMTERAGELRQIPFSPPAFDILFALMVTRTLLLTAIACAAIWALRILSQRLSRPAAPSSAPPATPATQAVHTPSVQ